MASDSSAAKRRRSFRQIIEELLELVDQDDDQAARRADQPHDPLQEAGQTVGPQPLEAGLAGVVGDKPALQFLGRRAVDGAQIDGQMPPGQQPRRQPGFQQRTLARARFGPHDGQRPIEIGPQLIDVGAATIKKRSVLDLIALERSVRVG